MARSWSARGAHPLTLTLTLTLTLALTLALALALRLALALPQLLGQVSYVNGTSSEVLSFKVPIGLGQLLRPHVITTQQFGGLWPAHASEKKQISHAGRFATQPQAFMGIP